MCPAVPVPQRPPVRWHQRCRTAAVHIPGRAPAGASRAGMQQILDTSFRLLLHLDQIRLDAFPYTRKPPCGVDTDGRTAPVPHIHVHVYEIIHTGVEHTKGVDELPAALAVEQGTAIS